MTGKRIAENEIDRLLRVEGELRAEIERLTMANQMFIRDEKTATQNVAMLRAEVARLLALLKEAGMLMEVTALYYPTIAYKLRLDACLLDVRAALEPKS